MQKHTLLHMLPHVDNTKSKIFYKKKKKKRFAHQAVVSSCLPLLLRALWKLGFLICSDFSNCLLRYSRTKTVQDWVYYKYSLRTDQLDWFCFPRWPFPAGCHPHLGGLLGARADCEKQKYKNHRTHCVRFEKKHPGKSPGERKTTILDEAVITLGYAQLSLGIYQRAPCLGFDPQL